MPLSWLYLPSLLLWSQSWTQEIKRFSPGRNLEACSLVIWRWCRRGGDVTRQTPQCDVNPLVWSGLLALCTFYISVKRRTERVERVTSHVRLIRRVYLNFMVFHIILPGRDLARSIIWHFWICIRLSNFYAHFPLEIIWDCRKAIMLQAV